MRILLILALALCLDAIEARSAAFDPFKATGIDNRPGAVIPLDGPFRDERGSSVSLRGLARGKVLLLAPVLHNCPNICGVTLSGLMDAVEHQSLKPAKDFVVVAFGIDPKEGPVDAAASVAALRRRFPTETANGFSALTGKEADIHAVTDALGYRYAFDPDIGQYAHDAAVSVITPDGHLSHWLYGLSPDPGDLKLAVVEAAGGRVGTLGDQLLLLCFHYDPVVGRYSSLVVIGLRAAGVATMTTAAIAIALAFFRERRRSRAHGEEV